MITVLNGTKDDLLAYTTKEYATPNDLRVIGSRDMAIPFTLIRILVALLRERLGDQRVEEALLAHRVPSSLIFNELSHTLSSEEQDLLGLVVADPKSNITHSRVAKHTLIDSYAKILIDLMGQSSLRIIIPDMVHMDIGSLDVLRHMCQVFPSEVPELVIGYDPDWGTTTHQDDIGVSWYYSVDSITTLQAFVYAFEDRSIHKEKVSLFLGQGDRPASSRVSHPRERLDRLDDGLEWKAFEVASLRFDEMDEKGLHLLISATRRCFRLFDFTNALFFGLKLLKAGVAMEKEVEAELCHMVALSAHNRHFFSQGNMPLANFIETMLRRSLASERDPARRVAILYRLVVTLSRRKGEHASAKMFLREAYGELENGDFEGFDRDMLYAWIDNIHSFLLMKQNDLGRSISYHERAFHRIDKIDTDMPIVREEIAFTRAVLAENLATLNSMVGDFETMQVWYAIETEFTQKWPNLDATSYAEWQSFYYQNLEMRSALEKTHEGLARSKDGFNYILEYFFTVSAADINYRLGDAEEALGYLRKVSVFHERLDYHYISPHILGVSLTRALLRSDRIEEAMDKLLSMKKTVTHMTSSEKIEIHTMLAECHASLGMADKCEEQTNKAIHLALQSGGCDSLFQVSLSAGRSCQLLGRDQDATSSYKNALDISKTRIDGEAYIPRGGWLAQAYLGLYECDNNTDHLYAAIAPLASSLSTDAEGWWHLERLSYQIDALPYEKREECLKRFADPLKVVEKALQQRKSHQNNTHNKKSAKIIL